MALLHTYLPASVISKKPFIFICFFEDFIGWRRNFKKWFLQRGIKKAYALFQVGFEYESAERVEYARKNVADLKKDFPFVEFIFLGNSPEETRNFSDIGIRAVYCNQNAFLNENRYGIPSVEKDYDAVYLARITPFKRHFIAESLPKILYIGDYTDAEREYAKKILARFSASSKWIRRIYGIVIYRWLARAKVGLALSSAEGAMFASAEYALCGLPVITVKSLGGRSYSLPPKYTFVLENSNPSAAEVEEKIKFVISQNFSPSEIRAAEIEVLESHRKVYRALLDEIYRENGLPSAPDSVKKIFHKMGVRCRVWPLRRLLNGMRLEK